MDNPGTILSFVRVSGLLSSVLLLVLAWVVARVLSGFFERVGMRFTDRRLLLQQVDAFTRFALYIAFFAAAVLLSFDLSREAMLTLGGTIAVTVGFALKDLAASVLAGLIILVDKPFQVGDRVSFGGFYGEITGIGLRSVRLVTLDDNLVTIPNNKFLTDIVSSGNAGALDMLVQMDFHVAPDQDIARAKQVVGDALTSSRYAFLQKPWTVLVSQVIQDGYFAVRLRAKVYVADVHNEKALETEVTEKVLAAFRAEHILPPAVLYRPVPAPGLPPASPPG